MRFALSSKLQCHEFPDSIKCSLCGCEFRVEPFTTTGRGGRAADVTFCKMRRANGSVCDRRFQHSGDACTDQSIIMRVHPDDIHQVWRDSMGLT